MMTSRPISSPPEDTVPEIVPRPRLTETHTTDEESARSRVAKRLRLLREESRFLFKLVACAVVFSAALALLIPNRYEARTSLMPPDGDSNSGLASLLALTKGSELGMLAGDFLGLKTSGPLFIGILRSRTLEDRIINKFDLRHVYRVRKMQDARKVLEANTKISEDRKSWIITMSVSDQSPQRAADVTQAYVQELNQLVADLNTSAAHRERVFLEERLRSVKQDLDSADKDFSEFSSKNTAIDIKEQGRAMVEAAAMLQGQIIASQSELEGLRQIYSDENVRVRAVKARVAELQKKLEEIGGGGLDADASNDDTPEALYPSIRKLPLLGVTYFDLYRRAKIQETVFGFLTQRYELVKVQEAKETPTVKVLDVAEIPEKRSYPPRRLIVFLGTFFAFVAGVLWILARASWKETEEQDPVKVVVSELYREMKAKVRIHAANGWAIRHMRAKILRFRSREE